MFNKPNLGLLVVIGCDFALLKLEPTLLRWGLTAKKKGGVGLLFYVKNFDRNSWALEKNVRGSALNEELTDTRSTGALNSQDHPSFNLACASANSRSNSAASNCKSS